MTPALATNRRMWVARDKKPQSWNKQNQLWATRVAFRAKQVLGQSVAGVFFKGQTCC
jgi:hypothetical protein